MRGLARKAGDGALDLGFDVVARHLDRELDLVLGNRLDLCLHFGVSVCSVIALGRTPGEPRSGAVGSWD